jgi:hypothetical protein
MLLGGVSVEEGLVRKLAAILDRPLENKLTQALLFRASIVALTQDEKAAVLRALERAPAEFDCLRDHLIADWRIHHRRL